ncbi:hypothetical protein [Butyrivibrio sp. LB2008]|uniref:hypothetical protein n=1 Tax=Butyrivibrio sp. LB2008 TaxID=1408305 RepID=UPI000479B48F
MNIINVEENKTLKLQNVLSCKMDFSEINTGSFDNEINKMNVFISTHGAKQIGPLIQYSSFEMKQNGEADVDLQFMLQSDNYINNVKAPYRMESVLRVKNCLFARYTGEEKSIKYAYDKLGVYAFENEIELEGASYTVFVNRDEEVISADIFMPIKTEE